MNPIGEVDELEYIKEQGYDDEEQEQSNLNKNIEKTSSQLRYEQIGQFQDEFEVNPEGVEDVGDQAERSEEEEEHSQEDEEQQYDDIDLENIDPQLLE